MSQWTYTHDPNYRSAGVDDQGRWRRVRYQVTTTDRNATEADIQQDSGFKWGDPDPLDATKYLRRIEVNREGTNPYYWELVLEYRSEVIQGYSPDQSQIPPLERPPEFTWSFENVTENIDRTKDGTPIATMSGETYDPPLQRQFGDLIAEVTFYSAVWNAAAMIGKVNCVNSDVWYGWPPKTVMFRPPRARSVFEPPWDPCYQITYTFACRPDSWTIRALHAGYKHWTGEYSDAGYRIIETNKAEDGTPFETPQPLDQEGKLIKLLPNGQYEKELVWMYFDVYPEIPFSVFGV